MNLRPFCILLARILQVLVFAILIGCFAGPGFAQTTASDPIYLPFVLRPESPPTGPRVNAPYFPNNIVLTETAIFWMGRVNANENYADVRVGYNPTELLVHIAIFDRRVWFDSSPSQIDLTAWDAISLFLDMDGNTSSVIDDRSFRFVGQLRWDGNPQDYQAVYTGGPTWNLAAIPFTTQAGYVSDNNPADDTDDRGWVISYRIPFSSLGMSGPPAQGSTWGLGVVLHDRDSAAGPPLPDKTWPVALDVLHPITWGRLYFGLPGYTPPPATPGGTVNIRHGVDGAVVTDAHVGGHTICGEPYNPNFFNGWGDANYAGYEQVNVQNQANLGDWPCFSKYYVTFPLNALPAGKTILSASLTLYQFGNSDPQNAHDSLIQVLTTTEDWNESTITWNNAPYAWENVSRVRVPVLLSYPGLPGVAREWDVSRAVAEAYRNGIPLRLVLYSADYWMHSGKYFYSSDMNVYAQTSRPLLTIHWGGP
ncbi:MAG: hypothetical protein A2W33_05585 [Chloroflexi bacterium RBG_16_52_11]|nr:MAG: hypothetical protein A2W33_05585 [Chloroflexi bacterium RBG_16_52_11]